MKLQLIIKQNPSKFGYNETRITHIKILDDEGKFIKFAKHEPELIEEIQNSTINL